MKRYQVHVGVIVAAAVLVLGGVWRAVAEINAYPVTLRNGKANTEDGQIKITREKIVGTDHLMLVLDTDNQEIRLVQVDSETNLVATLATSIYASFVETNETFAGIVEFVDLEIETIGFNTGAALLRGRTRTTTNSTTLVQAKWHGVLNDSVNGDPTESDRDFSVDIKATGAGFDAEDLGL